MKSTELSDHILATYKWIRVGTAVVALSLPPLLWIGGLVFGNLSLQDSMSAYYHAGEGVMRNEFVGILFAVGTVLVLYKGYSSHEDYALNLAGILALGIALFPMTWPVGTKGPPFSIHGFCAISFFVCIAYVCIFLSSDSLGEIDDVAKRKRYRRYYVAFGIAMVGIPALAYILTSIVGWKNKSIFFVEAAGVWVFAAYWLVKSHEISQSQLDQKIAAGTLGVARDKLSDTFRVNCPLKEMPIGVGEGGAGRQLP